MSYTYNSKELKRDSANIIVPFLADLFQPASVIDVGCGLGTWLSVFYENGITDILGIDGDYIDIESLRIPRKNFVSVDLENQLQIDRKYDLLICLEVAEHLSDFRAESFIREITQLSNIIIFSAAIPFQGGEGHLNEQYPEYWIKLFNKFGFRGDDILRPMFWNDCNINWWYRQNVLVFKRVQEEFNQDAISALISRELYESKVDYIKRLEDKIDKIVTGKEALKYYFKLWKRALKSWVK